MHHDRLIELEQLLLASSGGLTKAEISRRLRVHRATASRYVDQLSVMEPVVEVSPGRFALDRERFRPRLRLTIHEAMAVLLSVESMSATIDRLNPHLVAAIRALATALHPFAPPVGQELHRQAHYLEQTSAYREDAEFLQHLRMLTSAWTNRLEVTLLHYSVRRQELTRYTGGVDAIVPNTIGRTLLVVISTTKPSHNQSEGPVDTDQPNRRTLRLDRLQGVSKTGRSYQPEGSFDHIRYFADAWSVWRTDGPPTTVELRFSSRVAHRVRETIWHPSQELHPIRQEEGGGVIWRGRIAEPREMYPWIRGWGADVEIIKPAELRVEFAQEVREMRKLYEV